MKPYLNDAIFENSNVSISASIIARVSVPQCSVVSYSREFENFIDRFNEIETIVMDDILHEICID